MLKFLSLIFLTLSYSAHANNCNKLLERVIKITQESQLEEFINPNTTKLINHIFGSDENKTTQAFTKKSILRFIEGLPSIENLNNQQRKIILQVYLEHKFNQLKRINVQNLSNNSLALSLKNHGVEDVSKDPYKVLNEISKNNLERVKKQIPTKDTPLSSEVLEVINNIKLLPTHNSNVLRNNIDSPILSSFLLEKILTIGGFNTDPFNKTFLKSDDNIFFFPTLKNMSTKMNDPSEVYGANKITITDDLIHSRGWVSVFVMYKTELLTYGKDIRKLILSEGLPLEEKDELYKNSLYLYDFTPSDYEELVKEVLKAWMKALKENDYDHYSRLSSKPNIIIDYVDKAFVDVLGIFSKFEFKVPSIIEAKDIIEI